MKWTLLYFDDQIQNIECFEEFLSPDFNVIGTNDVKKFPEMLQNNYPHIILMDVHMPEMDGHVLYEKITSHPLYNECPIVFISGDQSDETKIKSLSGGAIDFLPRDISSEEILIRLKNKVKFFLERSTVLGLGNLEIDFRNMLVNVAGKDVDLTILELRMLSNILRHFPEFLTRSELIQKVWGNDSVKPGTINTHLTNLKPKIENWDYQIKVRDENVTLHKKEND